MTPTKDVSNRVVFKSPDTTTTSHNKSKNNNSTLEQILSTSVHAPPPEKKSESTVVQRCSNDDDDDDAKPSSSSSYNNTLNIWSVLLLLCSRVVVIKSVREMVKITKSASSSIDVVFEASCVTRYYYSFVALSSSVLFFSSLALCGVEDIVLCVESTPSRFHFDFEKRDQSSRRFVLTSSPLSLSLSNDAKKKQYAASAPGTSEARQWP